MTNTLTEQWREGKLPAGLYYIEGKGSYDIALIRNIFNPVLTNPYCEDDVFEPDFVPVDTVPSYYEYIELVTKCHQLEKKLKIATNALKEFRVIEHNYIDYYVDKDGNKIDLHPRRVATKALKEMEGVK